MALPGYQVRRIGGRVERKEPTAKLAYEEEAWVNSGAENNSRTENGEMSKGSKPIYVPTVVRAYAQVFISSDVCPQNQEYLKMWRRRSKKQRKGIGIILSGWKKRLLIKDSKLTASVVKYGLETRSFVWPRQ